LTETLGWIVVKIKQGPGWIGTKSLHNAFILFSPFQEHVIVTENSAALRSCKFLGFCSTVVEVSAHMRYGTASLGNGLTLYGFYV
jgi:hypothetical protein